MKKLFSTVIMAVFLSVCSYAQTEIHRFNEEGKVVFEGVALGTPIDEFKKNLEEKGYKLHSEVLTTCIFTKQSEAGAYRLLVSYTPKTKLVSHMTMNIGVKQEWEIIKKTYNYLSNELKKHLGTPLLREEKAPEDNITDIKTIAEGLAKENYVYITLWGTEAGRISVDINYTFLGNILAVVPSILYSDTETYKLFLKEKME